MKLSLFDYHLPEGLIAKQRQKRSRLLILNKKTNAVNPVRSHLINKINFDNSTKGTNKLTSNGVKLDQFSHITDYLCAGDLLVFNNTKVFKSRLFGHLESGGNVEIFLLNPVRSHLIHKDGTDNFTKNKDGLTSNGVKKIGRDFEALGRPGKKLTVGRKIIFTDKISGIITQNDGKIVHLRFNATGQSFEKFLEKHGHIPVPPYIKKEPKTLAEYQTVYAKHTGSVAAPTSGFHFTPALINKLKTNGIRTAELTLHIGLGTFLPVTTEKIEEHTMHAEEINVPSSLVRAINETKKRGGRVIAVGTTTTRALEGVALKFGHLKAYRGSINLFITPGFQFKVIDALITNFHLPKSTLLMLVSAFAGRTRILKAYTRAIKAKFKFFSFGDAMFIQ